MGITSVIMLFMAVVVCFRYYRIVLIFSSHDGNVDWPAKVSSGMSFAWVKATEGTSYQNPFYASQYNGSQSAGLIRGAYHFALPSNSSG